MAPPHPSGGFSPSNLRGRSSSDDRDGRALSATARGTWRRVRCPETVALYRAVAIPQSSGSVQAGGKGGNGPRILSTPDQTRGKPDKTVVPCWHTQPKLLLRLLGHRTAGQDTRYRLERLTLVTNRVMASRGTDKPPAPSGLPTCPLDYNTWVTRTLRVLGVGGGIGGWRYPPVRFATISW